ncbi:EscU/YscU/HrcU family type III secretion system export apparatus switch protein [Halobacillus sp. ACCC02827]|uniref:EscU/YscU/HrcU family type III secretion system export apparatus switch protein n=1 Tax=Bacillaceae TaxID=186817 RepID=UPI0002A4D129|nr:MULTISPECIES: EscU/YscU/HrcU family type III secretion system export apparatus switch protein [Bacillaceae]ELK45752.1 flagellar biosynthesis protein [Halobacillus sp. BAB-2008]QHT46642.1 hypothetical protein M662_09115 [Bacillus sp. SB49]WJE17668.1 EscU/YscU/HrcU family type III secretion system export apparatus switch protein [Halobacillus sp. ACCC02827]
MNKKQKRAVALRYQSGHHAAPVVKAKGTGSTADRILQKGEQHDVPVHEDPTLVELLSELDLNEHIPEDLYHVVAEVFAFVYKADKEWGNS